MITSATTDDALCGTWRVDAIDFGTMALALDPEWLAFITAQLSRRSYVFWALEVAAQDNADPHVRAILEAMARRDPKETYWP